MLGRRADSAYRGPVTRTLSIFLALAVAAVALPAAADQNDARLDGLFTRLQATSDAREARSIEGVIWAIWIESADAAINKEMTAGIAAMRIGDMRTALSVFDSVVEQAPDFAEGWNKRATVYYLIREFDASVRDVGRTLALEPRHFGALSGLGLIYLAVGEEEAAMRAMEKALTIHPHMPGIRAKVRELREKYGGKPI